MKLSELFKTPFKLKGGSTLNLRGFSKRVVDKEVGEGGGESESKSMLDKIFNLSMTPHNSKVVFNNTVVDLPDTPDGNEYFLLYKESDFNDSRVIQNFNYNYAPTLSIVNNANKGNTYEIDGESYITIQIQG